jgi:tRNA nucleotidyltransferase/poly(A) polymerase
MLLLIVRRKFNGINMEIYEVGGCVRDRLLGLDPKDIDYVVVGSSIDEMTKLGYELVGKDFPVFIHPTNGCEYALARTERKVGAGYGGFETEVANVSLEEDLFRRDLTINAIARDKQGNNIDPYNGQQDLDNKILRHVSNHFAEDPVRILRIARFAARYDFKIADETYDLMKEMVVNGEFDHLTKERVWKELEKTLTEPHIENFFGALERINALGKIFSFNNFQGKDFLKPGNTFDQNLCHIFSYCDEKEIKQWKMPEREQQLIIDYKKYYQNENLYTQLSIQEKLTFITLTKAMHDNTYANDLLELCVNYRNFKGNEINIDNEKSALGKDISQLKSIDYAQLVASVTDKRMIKQVRENAQIEALTPKVTKKPKF